MPKKRTPRQRQQAERRARAQRRQLAREEADREAHARLIVERSGDPRFVQRTRLPDGGASLTWDAASVEGQQMREGFNAQLQAFRVKFGREPGPEDPVFFDSDVDEPTPMTKRHWDEGMAAMAQAAADAGVDAAYIHAWQEVGYMVTDANRHLYSAAEVRAYLDAVARHRGEDLDDGELFDTDWDVPAEAAHGLRALVAETLATGSLDPGFALVEAFDAAEDVEAAGLAASTAVAVMLGWLTGARERLGVAAAPAAVSWVRDRLGPDPASQALVLAGVLGHPLAPELTVAQAFDRLGDALLPALLWLAAGLAATAGDGDAEWLTQFDPDLD
jgi:hypothetical protein